MKATYYYESRTELNHVH